MNITGIITEYNPFHNGHLHHLQECKKATKCDGTICIMSGNFMQRGGPAIIDKWKRAEMAIENGVDLVIELPTYYAVSSAEFFSYGALSILNSLGIVNNLFFGSESGDVESLTKIAQTLVKEPLEFQEILRKNINSGLTFAKARELALIEFTADKHIENLISSSNNILGIEYIKAILKLNSPIVPFTLKREGSNYNDKMLSNLFSSATSIREVLKNKNDISLIKDAVPEKTFNILHNLKTSNYSFTFEENMFQYIKYLITTDCINFNNISEVKEGIDKKISKEIENSSSLNELILNIKSKRYTYTKISRILTQIYIGFYKEDYSNMNLKEYYYARVLAFNDKGREMLSLIKKHSSIPLITKLPKNTENPLLKLDIAATKAYSILNPNVKANSD
ncbi:MAG: nucleotidyltransferase, partial [Clostridium sp.]|nr:nucleotidyltransferase [Clostridium sp.]